MSLEAAPGSTAVSWQAAFAALKHPAILADYARFVVAEEAANQGTINQGIGAEPSRATAPSRAAAARLLGSGLLVSDVEGGLRVDHEFFSKALESAEQAKPQGAEKYLRLEKLGALPQNAADRDQVLDFLCGRLFEAQRHYAEAEVNSLLRVVTDDISGLRRALVDWQFLDRVADGSDYWLRQEATVLG